MSLKLYELTDSLRGLEVLAEQQGSDELMAQALKDLGELHKEKALGVAVFIKNISAEAEAMRVEEVKLAGRRKAKENLHDRLKDYLRSNLKAGETIEGPQARIAWRKSTAIVVDDQNKLPPEYIKTVTTLTPMKDSIKVALDGGREVPGARIEQRQNISIS